MRPLILLCALFPVAVNAATLECRDGSVFTADKNRGLEFSCENISDVALLEISGWRGSYLLDGKRREFQRDVPLRLSRPIAPGEKRLFRLNIDEPEGKITDPRMLEIFAPRPAWQSVDLGSGLRWDCRDIRPPDNNAAVGETRFIGSLVNHGQKNILGIRDAVFFYGDSREIHTLKIKNLEFSEPLAPGKQRELNLTVPTPNSPLTRFGWRNILLREKK